MDHMLLVEAIFSEYGWSHDKIECTSVRSGPRMTTLEFRTKDGKRNRATMTFPTRSIPATVFQYQKQAP